MWEAVWKTGSALTAVLGAVALLRVALRAGGLAVPGRGRRLRLLETVALGGRQRLHVIAAGDEELLIASAENGVRLLRRLPARPAPEPAEEPAEAAAGAPEARSSGLWRRLRAAGTALVPLLLVLAAGTARAAEPATLSVDVDGLAAPERISSTLKILGLLTAISVAPSLLLMATCFTRILIVMTLLRQALGIHQVPPNQVLAGLALFMTIFVMAPVGEQVYAEAVVPYVDEEIGGPEAAERALGPVREWLTAHTRESDLLLFLELADREVPESREEVSFSTLLPAYMISELRTAFEIGFMIYLPFLIVDLVIASMLISLGMIVLPPMMIALPFKLMLFVLLDGWNLVVASLAAGLT